MYLESLIIGHRDDIIHDLFVLLPLAPWIVNDQTGFRILKIIHKMLCSFFSFYFFFIFFFLGGGGLQNITCILVVIQFNYFVLHFTTNLVLNFTKKINCLRLQIKNISVNTNIKH